MFTRFSWTIFQIEFFDNFYWKTLLLTNNFMEFFDKNSLERSFFDRKFLTELFHTFWPFFWQELSWANFFNRVFLRIFGHTPLSQGLVLRFFLTVVLLDNFFNRIFSDNFRFFHIFWQKDFLGRFLNGFFRQAFFRTFFIDRNSFG